MDRTYQELTLNDRRWIKINITRDNGEAYAPSAANYEVRGSLKQNILIPSTPATINGNQISARLTETITASAAEYDLIWEVRKDGDINFHGTELLVEEC
jgi:hypothetical protein